MIGHREQTQEVSFRWRGVDFFAHQRGCSVAVSRVLTCALLVMGCMVAAGKEKKKVLLPPDVLKAKTALVMIDPEAGMAVESPQANRTAQQDVEKALAKWGRFGLATDVSTADLVIIVRKGSGKLSQPTIGGVPNNRPDVIQPSEGGVQMGGRAGKPPMEGDPTAQQPSNPVPQIEVGNTEDSFLVYLGKRENVLDAPAVWRYRAKDALKSPGVPAVDAFRKAIAEAEKP